MKLEELTQEKLDEMLEQMTAIADSNKALKGDITKLRAKAKGADIDPEEHANLQTQVAELTDKLTKSEKTYKTESEKLIKSLSEKDGALTKYLLDANLTDNLAKARIKPELMDAAKALLKVQATIKAENGEYSALIGDKPIGDYVKEWATGDAGKHFVMADNNSGGGAQGGNGNGSQTVQGKLDGTDAERAAHFEQKFNLKKE